MNATTPGDSDRLADSTTNLTWTTSAQPNPTEWIPSPAMVAIRVTLLLVICVFGVASNSLNGLMLLKSKRPNTTMHILMFNLVAVDMTMSITCMPLSILFVASNGDIYIPDALCKVAAYLLHTLIIASLLTQSAISVIRTVAITFPEALQQRLPASIAYKIIIYIWLEAVLVPLLPFLSHDNVVDDLFTYQPRFMAYAISDSHTKIPAAVTYSVVANLIPLAIICVSYVILYVSLRRHMKKNFLVQDRCSQNMYTVQMRVQVKVGCLVIFVVSSTLLIWIPFYIMTSLTIFDPNEFESISRNASVVLIFGSSSVNPIMYGFMNTSLRQEFRTYLAAKHPKLVAILGRAICCRFCCKRKAKLDAVIVIPKEQIHPSLRPESKEGNLGSVSGQLVLQINHEISLKQQSVFSIRQSTHLGEPEANTGRQHKREEAEGVRHAVPPLVKRCSWTQSLAHNARRFSDKMSRRRSGSDNTLDGHRQLPLLDLHAVSQLREESHGQYNHDPLTIGKGQGALDPEKVMEANTDESKTKYNTVPGSPLSVNAKLAPQGHKDGSVVAVSRCFREKPVFGDIVKVRRVFIEELTLVPGGLDGPASQDEHMARHQWPLPKNKDSASPVDSQQRSRSPLETDGDAYATMTMQLPGYIQAIPEK